MDGRVVEVMVRAIESAGISLPGVNGDATTAENFAGHWSKLRKSAVTPFQGSRHYGWLEPEEASSLPGLAFALTLPSPRVKVTVSSRPSSVVSNSSHFIAFIIAYWFGGSPMTHLIGDREMRVNSACNGQHSEPDPAFAIAP